jgi:hypothetical protein
MISTRKQFTSSVCEAFVMENILSMAALVPEWLKEIPKWLVCFSLHKLEYSGPYFNKFVFHSATYLHD